MRSTATTDQTTGLGSLMAAELASQPQSWAAAAEIGRTSSALPAHGARVAVIGCGTSWFMAQAYASLRESQGFGYTDAFAASEATLDRPYDALVAITRSGTTTEVLEAVESVRGRIPVIGIVGDPSSPFVDVVDHLISLPFADERSVVQTRFATSALATLRTSLGENLDAVIADAETALRLDINDALLASEQFSFLGTGWSIGIAHEAALKMREAAQFWTESYSSKEYRHGPISIAAENRTTWMFGVAPEGLAEEVRVTGAHFEITELDPMADLIRAQRVALTLARRQHLDPDHPRNLTRSVILSA